MDVGYDPATPARHLELSTASGLIMAPLLRVRTLKCLGLTLKEVEVVAHHLPPESPVEGLLGLNVLTHFQPFRSFFHAIQPFAV